jgi:uncharacterized Zn-binding protein involved in type VI secretion
MAQRLTDRSLAPGVGLNNLIHIVITGDTTQNPAGSSFKATIGQLQDALSGPFGVPGSNGVYTYYSTIQSAINAASSGQTVEVFADYTETGTGSASSVNLKDGVNINFNGHTYTYNPNVANNLNAFKDNGVAVDCKMFNGTIQRLNTVNIFTLGNGCVSFTADSRFETDCTFISERNVITTSSSSSIVIGGKYISFSGTAASQGNVIAGSITDAYLEIQTPVSTPIVLSMSANSSASNCTIYSSGICVGVTLGTSATLSNSTVDTLGQGINTATNCVITNCVVKNTTTAGSITLSDDCSVFNTTIISTPTSSSISTGLRNIIYGCTIYNSLSNGIIVGSENTISNCNIISNNNCVGNRQVTIQNSSLKSLTQSTVRVTVSSGIPLTINNSTLVSLANPTIWSSSNTLLDVSNSVVECQWANTGGHSIWIIPPSLTSGHTIVNNHLITAAPAPNGINSTLANTGVFFLNNVFEGMTTSTFNINQQAPSSGDTKGNIGI